MRVVDAVSPQSRKPSAMLIAGIVLIPLVFAWLTLRKGYSGLARALSLGWLGASVAIVVLAPDPPKKNETPTLEPTEKAVPTKSAALPAASNISDAEGEAPAVKLPAVAASCGGDSSRNWRFAVDPSSGSIALGVVGKSHWTSKAFEIQDGKLISDLTGKDGSHYRVSFGRTDMRLNISSDYDAEGDDKAQSCYARVAAAQSDCADAGSVRECIRLSYPDLESKIAFGTCSLTESHWTSLTCDDLGSDNAGKLASDIMKF